MNRRVFAVLLCLFAAIDPPVRAQERLLLVVRGTAESERFVSELSEACTVAFSREGFVALALAGPQRSDPLATMANNRREG